jgi:hypothetical protein
MKRIKKEMSRRRFLQSAAGVAGFTIVPRRVLGGRGYTAPNEKLNIACVGVGGKGAGDVGAVSSENIVGLCDVDEVRAAGRIPRSIGHYKEWLEACKGGKKAGANFDYGGPLTEMVLLGNVAIRTGKKLDWDGPNMKVTNVPEANEYLHRPYRGGWTL